MYSSYELMKTMGRMIAQNACIIDQMGRMAGMGAKLGTARYDRRDTAAEAAKPMPESSPAFPGPTEMKKPSAGLDRKSVSAAKKTRVSRELDRLLDPARYSASGIAEEDLRHIVGLYGDAVENIYELGPGQKWMLEAGRRVKSAFFLQVLTKAVIPFDPAAFRQQAEEVCQKHESLRSAFVCKDVQQPYRVILKDRQPEINCFDLSDLDMEEFDERISKLMEADRRRGFNLEREALLRINIYKCCEENTYAIVVSQPHINSDGTSFAILFRDLFVGYALDMNGIDKKIESQSYREFAEHLHTVDKQKELEFWKETLKDAEEDQLLPGQQINALDYHSASLFVPFDERELSILEQAQKIFKVTQFTVLQGLWGIMTARLKTRRQMVFGAITSGRCSHVTDSMELSGGFVNAVPTKTSFEDDESLAAFFQKVQKDFLNCLEHDHLSPGEIQEALGRKQPLFSHLLNNHNFARPKTGSFSGAVLPGIKIIGGDVYDNLSEDLCVYFTVIDGKQGCNYSYNCHAFSNEVIQLLSENYKAMLGALEELGSESKISALPKMNAGVILAAQDTKKTEIVKIAGMLKKHPIFCGASDDDLIALAADSWIVRYTEGRMIVKEGTVRKNLPVLFKGRCILYGETPSGWNNPMCVLKEGEILDYSPLFSEEKTTHTVMSSSPGATVVFIPEELLKSFLYAHPAGFLEITRMVDRDRQRFMKLWMKAE